MKGNLCALDTGNPCAQNLRVGVLHLRLGGRCSERQLERDELGPKKER